MKNLLVFGAAAAITTASSTYASDTAFINLSGTLEQECNVTTFVDDLNNLDMTNDTTEQGADSISPICNYGGTLDVTLSSANNGELQFGPNSVDYTVRITGGLLPHTQLLMPVTITNWPAVANAVQTRGIWVQLMSAANVAGTYTDVITVQVAPN